MRSWNWIIQQSLLLSNFIKKTQQLQGKPQSNPGDSDLIFCPLIIKNEELRLAPRFASKERWLHKRMQCNNSLDYFKAFLIIFSTCGSNHKIQFREPTILKNQPERKKNASWTQVGAKLQSRDNISEKIIVVKSWFQHFSLQCFFFFFYFYKSWVV